jgi:hypothetical protein
MDPIDAAETINEVEEEAREAGGKVAGEKFRSLAALTIALMAMLLAIASLGGGNVAEDMVATNIQAGNLWAFYQAKNARQTSFKLAADSLEAEIRLHENSLKPEVRQSFEKTIQEYNETVARYESEPDKGEGKKELSARAKEFEALRDRAMLQDTNFDFAEALFQIAIVLASVAILSYLRAILKLSIVLGVLATVLMLNGFFLLVRLPF